MCLLKFSRRCSYNNQVLNCSLSFNDHRQTKLQAAFVDLHELELFVLLYMAYMIPLSEFEQKRINKKIVD